MDEKEARIIWLEEQFKFFLVKIFTTNAVYHYVVKSSSSETARSRARVSMYDRGVSSDKIVDVTVSEFALPGNNSAVLVLIQ